MPPETGGMTTGFDRYGNMATILGLRGFLRRIEPQF